MAYVVEPLEQRKIIQNATRRNKMKSTGNDVNETIEAEGNLQDVIEMLVKQSHAAIAWLGKTLYF